MRQKEFTELAVLGIMALLVLGVVVLYFVFQNTNTSDISTSIPIQERHGFYTEPTEEEYGFYTEVLLEDVRIGNALYRFVVETSAGDKLDFEKYKLIEVGSQKREILLYEGGFSGYVVGDVIKSPDSSKIIVASGAGDGSSMRLFIVDPPMSEILDFRGVYSGLTLVTEFVDNENVKIEQHNYDYETGVDSVSYWLAPVDDLSDRTELDR